MINIILIIIDFDFIVIRIVKIRILSLKNLIVPALITTFWSIILAFIISPQLIYEGLLVCSNWLGWIKSSACIPIIYLFELNLESDLESDLK